MGEDRRRNYGSPRRRLRLERAGSHGNPRRWLWRLGFSFQFHTLVVWGRRGFSWQSQMLVVWGRGGVFMAVPYAGCGVERSGF